ncbi:cuticle protein 19 [Aedes aegypti]|uniref:Adult cuticle protein n=1 Tax=Aedes aegypti TaxID=7159 RepID=A0A6I8TH04_AEDAE|nr:cuticle protein 19 [Aedes aegypti]
MFQIVILAAYLVASCSALQDHSDDWGWNGKYKFEYGVKDPHTGDHKSQWEISDGHGLKGGYTLDEPDGTKHYVEYKADKWHGFQAIVKRVGHAIHPKTYGTPFVVKHKKQNNEQINNGYGYEEKDYSSSGYQSSNGQNAYSSVEGGNGWINQKASSSRSNNANGWINGNENNYATSYVKQKSYY